MTNSQENIQNIHKSVFRRPNKNKTFASDRTWMQDNRLPIQATGLLAKMLSMPEDWEFHQTALVKTMPNGVDAIRSAMKICAKFGYLIKLPPTRNEKGQYDMIEYEVFDIPQFVDPLDDETVDNWFGNKPDWDKIKKKIPKRDFPVPGNPLLQYNTTYYKKKNNNSEASKLARCSESQKQAKPEQRSSCLTQESSIKENLKAKVKALKPMTSLTEVQIMSISKNYTLELISSAVELALMTPEIKAPYQWLCKCIRDKFWLTADPERMEAHYLFGKLKELLFKIKSNGKVGCRIDIMEKSIEIQKIDVGAHEITANWLSKLDDPKKFINVLNNKYLLPEKLNYATINGKTRLELCNYED